MDYQIVHMVSENWTYWPVNETSDKMWFENVNVEYWKLFSDRWSFTFAVCIPLFYFTGVYFCQKHMQNRPAYDNWKLTSILLVYNIGVSIFSVVALIRLRPLIPLYFKGPNAFHNTLCHRWPMSDRHVFWYIAFGWSKLFHLADTFFMILKNKPLPFMHVFHHIVMAVLPHIIMKYTEPILLFFGLLNMFQHSLTYPFFALKCLKIKLPKTVSAMIVLIELVQMVLGLIGGLYTVSVLNGGQPCTRHPVSIKVFNFLYTSFTLLALHMTYDFFSKKWTNITTTERESKQKSL